MLMPDKNQFIEVTPLPQEVIDKLLKLIQDGKKIIIAGVDWMHESTIIDSGGIRISLQRPGTKYLEQVAYEGTYIRDNDPDIMIVSANTLATMLNLIRE
jgi:ABC-type Fe3+-hydroxamate transport system substrate-binding protein